MVIVFKLIFGNWDKLFSQILVLVWFIIDFILVLIDFDFFIFYICIWIVGYFWYQYKIIISLLVEKYIK